MRLNILIGGKAGQGVNTVSEILTKTLIDNGYYIFNYRDYPSIIRGGHNFNVVSISDKEINSHESRIDGIVAIDSNTKKHETDGFIIDYKKYVQFGLNMNIALAGALLKKLGLPRSFKHVTYGSSSLEAAKFGYDSETAEYVLKKLNNKLTLMTGNQAAAVGAIRSKLDIYFAYPMTPATGLLHELASKVRTVQPEGEISTANMALGASFSGARVMVGTSGGGFDLMSEGLSFQGIAELPLVVYLASRVGPGTGVPTYSLQGDLEDAIYAGHGEFPRVVIAPGDAKESIEIVNQGLYIAHKHNCLVIVLTDKHVAESEFSFKDKVKILPVKNKTRHRATSYENVNGLTTEDEDVTREHALKRLEKYSLIAKGCEKFDMVKVYGKGRNLIIGWGSTKGAIVDAIKGLDFKFLQVVYMNPLSDRIQKEIDKAKKVYIIENNLTGQLAKMIGGKIKILKFDGRPFTSDELRWSLEQIQK